MIGGTILGLHGCGADPGFAMRRGSLILGRAPGRLLATFTDNGASELPWLRLLAASCAGRSRRSSCRTLRLRRWTGCASVGGKGEFLVTS